MRDASLPKNARPPVRKLTPMMAIDAVCRQNAGQLILSLTNYTSIGSDCGRQKKSALPASLTRHQRPGREGASRTYKSILRSSLLSP